MNKKSFIVGRTIRKTHEHPNGVPCILVDGDSVLCEFPSHPHGWLFAQIVCRILNESRDVLEEQTDHKGGK